MPTEQELLYHGKVVCKESGGIQNGSPFWKYILLRYNHKLYVIEYHPNGSKLDSTIKVIDY